MVCVKKWTTCRVLAASSPFFGSFVAYRIRASNSLNSSGRRSGNTRLIIRSFCEIILATIRKYLYLMRIITRNDYVDI